MARRSAPDSSEGRPPTSRQDRLSRQKPELPIWVVPSAIGGGLLVIAIVALILNRDPAALKRARALAEQTEELIQTDRLQLAIERIDMIAATAETFSHPEMTQILERAERWRREVNATLAVRLIEQIGRDEVHARATAASLQAASDRLAKIQMEHPASVEVEAAAEAVNLKIAACLQELKREAEARLAAERVEAGRLKLRELQMRTVPLMTESRFGDALELVDRESADISAIAALAPLIEQTREEILSKAEEEFARQEAAVVAGLDAGNMRAALRALDRIADGYGVGVLAERARQLTARIEAAQRESDDVQYRAQRGRLDAIARAAMDGLRQFNYKAARDAVAVTERFEGSLGDDFEALRAGVALQDRVLSRIISTVQTRPYTLTDIQGSVVRADQTHCMITLGRGGSQAQARREYSQLSARDMYGLAESLVERDRDSLVGLLLFALTHATRAEAARAFAMLEERGVVGEADLPRFEMWLSAAGVTDWADLVAPVEQVAARPATTGGASTAQPSQPGVMPGFESLGEPTIGTNVSRRSCIYCDGAGVVRHHNCFFCAGRGANCNQCNGRARLSFNCSTCQGNKTIRRGTENVTCPTCSGKGHYPCAACNGDGTIAVPNRDRHQGATTDCPTCIGSGHSGETTCYICTGRGTVRNNIGGGWFQRLQCPLCRGEGKAPPRCGTCRGVGAVGRPEQPTPCRSCSGKGVFHPLCPTCRGAGWVPLR